MRLQPSRTLDAPLSAALALPRLWIFAGTAYPAWYLLAPSDAQNPFWAWCLIGASYLATGLAARRSALPLPYWFFLPAFTVAVHQHWLLSLNPDHTFFAVAAVMAVLTSIPILEDRIVILAYSGLVIALSLFQAVTNNVNTVFFSTAVAWAVLLTNRFVRVRASERRDAANELHTTQSQLAAEKAARMRIEQELVTAQRMDSLGRLAGAFSHEFNNQLMAIRIHADLLGRSLPADAPQRRDVSQIQLTTSSAADLTARLLAFSRPTRTREEPADLCAVLRQNAVTLRHLMAEQTIVTLALPEGVAYAPVGAKQLGQIVLNLALNARDAMPRGGSLRLEVAQLPSDEVELPVEIATPTLVRFTVSDSGAGMSADVRDRLFEPFFTTKAERGNSGLGLSVVYGLVKETGGHVRVTSEPGKGARFDIYWPTAVAVAAGAPEPGRENVRPHRGRILLVEDQEALRDGLTRWLADLGYVVIACESAEEALTRANDIDAIASDVVLRGMDGIELLGRLRRASPQLPAVLFSGHLDHLAQKRREVPEGVRFLEKPFAPEALMSTLEALVDRRAQSTLH